MFEGIGILLIIPVLTVIGISSMGTSSVPFLDSIMKPLQSLPTFLLLPSVLGTYVLIILLQGAAQRSQTIVNMEIQQGFMRFLRINIYRDLLESNWSFFLQKRKSDFSHVLTQELGRVGMGVFQFLRLSTTIVFTLIQIAIAFFLSFKLTVFFLAGGMMVTLISRKFVRYANNLGFQTSDLSQSYMNAITEHFNGIKDIKTNTLEQHHLNWFQELCKRMEDNYNLFTKLQSSSQFFYKAASAFLIAFFIYLSITVIHTPVEQLALVGIIFSRLWPRLSGLQANWEQLVNSLPAFHTLAELEVECNAYKEQNLNKTPLTRKPLRMYKELEFHNVHFRYDPKSPSYTLQDIHFTIKANEMTAIVGKSGAGKSTLIDILVGLVKPEHGEIYLDGEPYTPEIIQSLRGSISYVAQDPFLFHSSIRENLLLVNPEATEEQLWQALDFSASKEFVRMLPNGIDTVIGDRGIRLSGGERQRIVLARAILRKPSILVLDEATSALDNENEAIIQHALERLKGHLTIIVIAHRLSTIRNADQVLVLENGRIIQYGGYSQLSKETKGTFNKLLEYQLK